MHILNNVEFTDFADPQLLSIGPVTLEAREQCVELDMASDIGQARLQVSSDFVIVHGHRHDSLESSPRCGPQRFRFFRVGLRCVTAIDEAGNAEILEPVELDAQRSLRQRQLAGGESK